MSARDDILSMFDSQLSEVGQQYLRDLLDLHADTAVQTALNIVGRSIRTELTDPPLGTTRKVSYELGMKRALKLLDDVRYAGWQK